MKKINLNSLKAAQRKLDAAGLTDKQLAALKESWQQHAFNEAFLSVPAEQRAAGRFGVGVHSFVENKSAAEAIRFLIEQFYDN